MKNINTASNLAQLILGLPNTLWSLPVFYEDCDCGNRRKNSQDDF